MPMFRREKWWIREIERLNREHAEERRMLLEAALNRPVGDPRPFVAPVADAELFEYTDALDREPE